ncbi:MAG: hypothetical protein ACXAEU_20580 [Candidatus Hodarchaeales archaeon]|jgi:hypothetical protein
MEIITKKLITAKNSLIHNLNISITDNKAITDIQFDSTGVYVSVNFNEIVSTKFIDDKVLVIEFENGEFYLDLTREEMVDWT